MFGSLALEIAISLALLYLLLGLLCSMLNEWVAGMTSLRAKNLWDGVRNLLYDSEGKGLAKDLYDHPLIKNLAKPGQQPSYVPSRTFALALFDLIAPAGDSAHTKTMHDVKTKVASLSNPQVRTAVLTLIDDAGEDLKQARENVEQWYDDAMDRVSGWYRKKAQALIVVWALAVTVTLNADTILIANTLAHDASVRASMVALAEATAKESLPQEAQQLKDRTTHLYAEVQKLGLPIGWSRDSNDPTAVPSSSGEWVLKIIGLMITTIAASLGAPFWFDVLNRMINIRSAGKQPERTAQGKDQPKK